MQASVLRITICFYLIFTGSLPAFGLADAVNLTPRQANLLRAGDEMLENLEISYVYGGSKVGSLEQCEQCNACLEKFRPSPKERFTKCTSCNGCSLDCSHFTQLVYARVGLDYPYLTTSQMSELSPRVLEQKYKLLVVGTDIKNAEPGDLLVYPGHVVMLESSARQGFGDIIHATGGKDIREPGQGIQRERRAQLLHFRGDLRRILRHRKLEGERVASYRETTKKEVPHVEIKPGLPALGRLRPVEKKNP